MAEIQKSRKMQTSHFFFMMDKTGMIKKSFRKYCIFKCFQKFTKFLKAKSLPILFIFILSLDVIFKNIMCMLCSAKPF